MILSLFLLLGCKSEDPIKETTFDPYDDLIHIQSHLPVIDPLIKFLRMREKRGMS